MKESLRIKELDHGFLIQREGVSGSYQSIAGLTNGHDLCKWIAAWSGADINVIETSEPVGKIDIETELANDAADRLIDTAEIAAQEPQESDPEPVADKPSPKAERPPAPSPEMEQAEERQTMNSRVTRFIAYLDKQGASKKWVKASYTDISVLLDVTAPIVKSVIDHAKEMYPRLRSVRVMTGEAQGNNFTLNQDIPEPGGQEQPEQPRNPTGDLTSNQIAVLAHIKKCAAKNGSRFQIELGTLATKAGVAKGSIYYHCEKLAEHGLISFEKQHNGTAPFITLLEERGEAA